MLKNAQKSSSPEHVDDDPRMTLTYFVARSVSETGFYIHGKK